jgi:hypothetical protein
MYIPYQIMRALEDERLSLAERDRRAAMLRRAHHETRKTRRQDHRPMRVRFSRTTA